MILEFFLFTAACLIAERFLGYLTNQSKRIRKIEKGVSNIEEGISRIEKKISELKRPPSEQ